MNAIFLDKLPPNVLIGLRRFIANERAGTSEAGAIADILGDWLMGNGQMYTDGLSPEGLNAANDT